MNNVQQAKRMAGSRRFGNKAASHPASQPQKQRPTRRAPSKFIFLAGYSRNLWRVTEHNRYHPSPPVPPQPTPTTITDTTDITKNASSTNTRTSTNQHQRPQQGQQGVRKTGYYPCLTAKREEGRPKGNHTRKLQQ